MLRTWSIIGFVSIAWCFVCISHSSASTGEVTRVTVRTRAKGNPNPSIWYRVPCDYQRVPGRRWRTLVIFGGRNCGGKDDEDRMRISRQFAYRRREAGGAVLWKSYGCGHCLDPDALSLARAWIAAFSGERPPVRAWGEDDTMLVRPSWRIDQEFRNPLYTEEIESLWR